MYLTRVLAVDCGASHVACGQFVREGNGRLQLERLSTEPLPSGESDDEEWTAGVGTALKALRQRERLRGACILAVPGHLTFTRLIKVPRLLAHQRRKIIRFEARQSVPFALKEVVWSQMKVAEDEGVQEVAITAARRPLLAALCAAVNDAGFHPFAIMPSWFVLRHGICHHQTESKVAPVLSIGARSIHFVFYGASRFFMRTVALGGNAVTQRIAVELGLEHVRAESLKRQVMNESPVFPADAPESMAVQIAVEQFARQLCGEVSRTLAGFCPEGGAGRPARLYLTGGGSLIPGLPAMLAERLQLRVERWEPLRQGAFGADKTYKANEFNALADLIGLAGCAASREQAGINLLPGAWRWESRCLRWWPRLAAAALLVVTGLLVPILHYRATVSENQRRTAEMAVKIDVLHRLDDRNHANLARLAETNRRIATLQRVVAARSSWVEFLADLQNRLVTAEDVWLEGLQLLPPGKPPATPGNAGMGIIAAGGGAGLPEPASQVRLHLTGCLFDADNPVAKAGAQSYRRAKSLLEGLAASPFVTAVENERFDGSQPGMLRFEITLVVASQKLL